MKEEYCVNKKIDFYHGGFGEQLIENNIYRGIIKDNLQRFFPIVETSRIVIIKGFLGELLDL